MSDLTAGKLPPKLSDRIADVPSRQWTTQTGYLTAEIDCREAVIGGRSLLRGTCAANCWTNSSSDIPR